MSTLTFPNTRRLLRLAEILDSLPRGRFDYSQWVGDDWKGAKNLSCGTAACALGWATTVPSWGLKLRHSRYSNFVDLSTNSRRAYDEIDTSIRAGAVAFGLTYEEAFYIFMPGRSAPYDGLPDSPEPGANGRPVSAKRVSTHLRRFVRFAAKHRDLLRRTRARESL